MSLQVIKGLVLRYVFLYSRTSFRVLDIFFWPAMDLLVWGFVSAYLLKMSGGMPGAITFLIGAAILWNVLYRAQQAVTVSFLEDVWSRNLLNIFVAPVRVTEFIAATYLVGLLQTVIVIGVMSAIALFYSFNMFQLGLGLLPFFANLIIFGWSIGLLTTGLILRFGHQAEALAWAVPFLIQPVCAVFYPVSILPPWLQPVAQMIPATHVFEGMRAVLVGHPLPVLTLLTAAGLNVAYLLFAGWLFMRLFQEARARGLLAKIGT